MSDDDELIARARARVKSLGRCDIETESEILLWLLAAALEAAKRSAIVIHTGDSDDRLRAWNEGFGEAQKQWAESAPKPRTVATLEELDALPVGSVVRCNETEGLDFMTVGERHADGWTFTNSYLELPSHASTELLPATILYTPGGTD